MAGFPKGSKLDDLNNNRTQGSYGRAKNIILNKETLVETENGYIVDITLDKPLVGHISIPDGYIAFTTNETIDEIGIIKGSNQTVIFRSAYLGFNLNTPIKGVYTYNRDGDLIIVWVDTTIRILNVDHPQFTHGLDANKYLIDEADLDLINLFTNTSKLNVNVVDVVDNGGSLNAGSYQIAIAYGFIDGTITPANELSNCISIIKAETTLKYDEVDGGVDEESTSKAIRFSLSEISSIYDGIYVYVSYKGTDSNQYVKRSSMFNNITSSSVIEIGSIDNWDTVDIKEVTVDKSTYNTCKDLAVVDNQLMIVGATGTSIYDIKSIASAINVKWTYDQDVNLDQVEGSYKDAKVIYAKKGFRPGEVYALYLGLKLKKGGYTTIEHIPGRVANTGDKTALVSDTYEYSISEGVLTYQIADTCTTDYGLDKGTMSYWENKDEQYDTDVALTGNVRHHKFPSLYYLRSKFLGGSAAAASNKQYDVAYASMGPDDSSVVLYGMYLDFVNNGNVVSNDGTVIVNHDPVPSETGRHTKLSVIGGHGTVYVKLNLSLHIIVSVPSVDINNNPITDAHIKVIFQIFKVNTSNGTVVGSPMNITDAAPYDITGNADIVLNNSWDTTLALGAGESIWVTAYVHNNDSGHKEYILTSCTASFDNASIILDSIPVAMSDPMTGRVLGIEVSNVIIPDNIKNEVEGWEVFYAERKVDDMTRLSQSILVDNTYTGNPNIPAKNCNFHGFDLLTSNINVNPTHTETQYAVSTAAINTNSRINTITRSLQLATLTDAVRNKVISSRYVPANFTSTDLTISNRYKEAALRLKLDQEFVTTYYNVVDLCAIKNNVFFDYHNQTPVSTGIVIDKDTTSTTIFGGDTYLSMYTIHLFKPDDTGVIKTVNGVKNTVYAGRMPYTITLPVYSIYNIGLRKEGTLVTEKLYPKTPTVLTTEFPNRDIYFGYNQVYTGLNNVTKVIIRPRFNTFTNLFPNRLHLSLKPSDEAVALNWRTFLAGDYKTIPFNKGSITGVQVQGNQLIIVCKYATFKIGIKDVLSTDGFDAYLKRGELFDRPVEELIKTNDGYIGSEHKFAMTTNELGTFVIDSNKRKIYIIGSDIKELVKEGYVNLMNTVLAMPSSNQDNPFFLSGCTIAIDRTNDRVLFLIVNNSVVNILSYSYLHNCWICNEHEYMTTSGYQARAMFSNRVGTYIVYSNIANDNTGTSKVINISTKITDTCVKQDSYFIQAILGDNLPTKKLYESLMWSTHTSDDDPTETFDVAQVYADNQGDVMSLVPETTTYKHTVSGNIQNIKGLWVLGDIHDQVADTTVDTFNPGYSSVANNIAGHIVGINLAVRANLYYKVINKGNGQTVNCVYNGNTYTEDMMFKIDGANLALTSIGSGADIVLTKPKKTIGRIVNDHLVATLVYLGSKKLYVSDISAKFINTI